MKRQRDVTAALVDDPGKAEPPEVHDGQRAKGQRQSKPSGASQQTPHPLAPAAIVLSGDYVRLIVMRRTMNAISGRHIAFT
ncbi:hypothetical protein [Novosphingobium olei]|uniref:hypothetical protein n=1 Tax=Novosphingobium olei TaxID=2728851 RepID=UPI00146BCB48|nr:hypothetical protein [Novosphingobium olei]